ncbi:Asp23/Gls24 family envelope stress response protein [Nocardia uniformis]|uniref:Asp23/Gls24 family envelope stress response protein n=1 Tax=Nocardia uniformis TaxID=53432 RepID=A0A849C8P7_9NOCA|nr:hypothetical protein [Nocardia uniformis]NNH72257.1 Asp23/Gls24 family envelope stress response protein [Nocardia uniformis]
MTAAVALELPGTTTISERAVARIAERAAVEVDGVGSRVSVDADVTSDAAALRMRLPIRYPLPVGRVAADCRTHVVARVGELAGLMVTGVDIVVSAMVVETAPAAAESSGRRVL